MANDNKNAPAIMEAEFYQNPDEEGRIVENSDLGALVALNSSEIDRQIATAHRYPRSLTGFRRDIRDMVTLDQEVALSCMYAMKRGGKVIEGPSARFAEVAVTCWGNNRAGSRVVDIGEVFITAQGAFMDLEKNTAVSYEVLRRITDSKGERYGDDMIGVTGNAACSIAMRNATLKGIPRAFWWDAYQAARKTSVGSAQSMANMRGSMLERFKAWGVEPWQIYGLLEVEGIEDVTTQHLVLLGGIHTAIKDNEATVEQTFGAVTARGPGTMVPPRPKRSEFDRQVKAEEKTKPAADQPAVAEKKPDPSPAPTHAQAEATQAKPAEASPAEQQGGREPQEGGASEDDGSEQAEGEPAATAEAQTVDDEAWFADMKALLQNASRIPDVADLTQSVYPELTPAQQKEWDAIRDARTKAILTPPSKKRPGK